MPSGPRLNLTQLSTLRELVRRGTLAAAAEHLGYTPGAVSQHLASLEATLGVGLVERSGRHLVLTDAGRVMAEHAEELLTAEARAVNATRSAHDAVAGPLIVGTWGSSAATLLAPLVSRMSVAFPEVSISSREVDLDSATASVRYGEVDVAFGLDYPDAPMPRDKSLHLVRLQAETFAVAVGAGSSQDVDVVDPLLASGAADPRSVTTSTLDALNEMDWILPAGELAVRSRSPFGVQTSWCRTPCGSRGDRHRSVPAARRSRARCHADDRADAPTEQQR